MKKTKTSHKNQRGIALLLALFTTVIITYLVVEISYETNVEYIVNTNAVNKLKAYYAARSALDLGLLRVKLYQQASKQLANAPAEYKSQLDMIWSFPFAWPIAALGDSELDKSTVNEINKNSIMDATYTLQISDEGSKIDINDLDSPSKGLRQSTRKLLMGIFENRMANDEEWARKNRDLKYEEVINNITDWIDSNQEALNGGDERGLYETIDADLPKLPPNRAFRTLDEMRMVAGMTEDIFQMLRERCTVFGMKAINPNYATPDVLKSIDPSFTDEVVGKITERRSDPDKGGPFADATTFWQFVAAEGGRVPEEVQKDLPLVFDKAYNFRIKAIGEVAGIIKEIQAVTFDTASVADTLAKRVKKEKDEQNPTSSTSSTTTQPNPSGNNNNLSKGPPRIVYFYEK